MTSLNQPNISRSLLTVSLVFIETALTLMLRFDAQLRKTAYPLAKSGVVVCIRSYLPHVEIFATFSYKGVLIDDELPSDKDAPDVIINAYSLQLVNAVISNDVNQINKIQMRGEPENITLVKNFLLQLGVGSLVKNILSKFKNSDKSEEKEKKEDKLIRYKQQIEEQEQTINTLTIKNRELETTVKQLQSQEKMIFIALTVVCIINLIGVVIWFSN